MTRFRPDARVPIDIAPSPNHGERRSGATPTMLVLHYTGMPDAAEALKRLCSAGSEVSAHYFVFEDGRTFQCVPEERRAWHAGVASWAGVTDINSHSIGIEIANPGHEHGYVDFDPRQIQSVISLCADIVARHGIRADRILAHSDVAPLRKQDPGEKFPWRSLAAAGVGHWVEPAPVELQGASLRLGDTGTGVVDWQLALGRYGYALEPSGTFDRPTEAVTRAFQRHYRPVRVDGVADASTMATLHHLLTTFQTAQQV